MWIAANRFSKRTHGHVGGHQWRNVRPKARRKHESLLRQPVSVMERVAVRDLNERIFVRVQRSVRKLEVNAVHSVPLHEECESEPIERSVLVQLLCVQSYMNNPWTGKRFRFQDAYR